MAQAAVTLTWSAATQTYAWSGEPGGALSPLPDSPAWFARLAEFPSFAFHGQAGSFTARQERRERGERYWYAYRRTGQQVRKKYLGKTADLKATRLEQVASMLVAQRIQAAPPPSAGPEQQEPSELKASLPGDPFTPWLSTKLHIPRPPARLVPRSRLIERLQAGLLQPLILLSAPAGFGKTTLLAEWLADCALAASSRTRSERAPLF